MKSPVIRRNRPMGHYFRIENTPERIPRTASPVQAVRRSGGRSCRFDAGGKGVLFSIGRLDEPGSKVRAKQKPKAHVLTGRDFSEVIRPNGLLPGAAAHWLSRADIVGVIMDGRQTGDLNRSPPADRCRWTGESSGRRWDLPAASQIRHLQGGPVIGRGSLRPRKRGARLRRR